jgi:hypothetical protein
MMHYTLPTRKYHCFYLKNKKFLISIKDIHLPDNCFNEESLHLDLHFPGGSERGVVHVVEAPAVVVPGLVARAAMPDGVVGVVRGAFHREANRHRLLI